MLIFARVLRTAAINSVRRASTTGTTAGQEGSMIDHIPWRPVAIGVAGGAIGFFGKMLHDDNLATRAELQAVRKDAREDVQALEARVDKRFDSVDKRFDNVDKRFDKIEDGLKEISGYLRPTPNK